MAKSNVPPPTWFFLDTLRRYVLTPLDSATEVTEREQAEIKEEQAAFDEFSEKLEMSPPNPEGRPKELPSGLVLGNSTSESMTSIRDAYRETVFAVSHYEEVYGEALLDNVAAELGPDLAEVLDPEENLANSESITNGFRITAARASQRRHAMGEALGKELDSIERARQKLVDLVGELDSTTIPDWYQTPFQRRLDGIARERQETIHDHPSPASGDSNLCEYLYQDQPWTYPVLTAIGRVQESVDLGSR